MFVETPLARPVLPLRRLTTYYTYKQSYHLQVYERAAIERHLSQSKGTAIDPISRQALPNRELTPVYILRSRATEFREHTARQNLERACSAACLDPVCSSVIFRRLGTLLVMAPSLHTQLFLPLFLPRQVSSLTAKYVRYRRVCEGRHCAQHW